MVNSKRGSKKPHPQKFKITTWEDILYRQGGKVSGFFVVLVLGSIALIRSNKGDIPKVIGSIFSSSTFCWIGWVIAVLILIFSLILGIIMWRIYPRELERVCKERDKLQEMLTGRNVQHSGRR